MVARVIPEFLPEIWGLYIAGSIIFALRFAVRLRTVGIRDLSGDDYFAMCAWLFYTIDAVMVDRAYQYGTNIDFIDEIDSMTDAEVATVSKGSKFELVAWFSYSAMIWSMKATMIFFYRRLTFGLWQQRLVRWLGFACVATYIGVLLTIFLGCRPFSSNWQVRPSPGLACTFRPQNIGVVSAFNIATDVALLSVPLPLLWRLQVPRRQKIVVAAFLLTGVFVIAAAVIRAVVTLGSAPWTSTINIWGVRETIVALVCVNAPLLRPLFLRRFWTLDPWTSSAPGRGPNAIAGASADQSSSAAAKGSRFASQGTYRSGNGNSRGVGGVYGSALTAKETGDECSNDAGSEEYIMKSMAKENADRVVVEVEVEITSEERTQGDHMDVEMGNSWGLRS